MFTFIFSNWVWSWPDLFQIACGGSGIHRVYAEAMLPSPGVAVSFDFRLVRGGSWRISGGAIIPASCSFAVAPPPTVLANVAAGVRLRRRLLVVESVIRCLFLCWLRMYAKTHANVRTERNARIRARQRGEVVCRYIATFLLLNLLFPRNYFDAAPGNLLFQGRVLKYLSGSSANENKRRGWRK